MRLVPPCFSSSMLRCFAPLDPAHPPLVPRHPCSALRPAGLQAATDRDGLSLARRRRRRRAVTACMRACARTVVRMLCWRPRWPPVRARCAGGRALAACPSSPRFVIADPRDFRISSLTRVGSAHYACEASWLRVPHRPSLASISLPYCMRDSERQRQRPSSMRPLPSITAPRRLAVPTDPALFRSLLVSRPQDSSSQAQAQVLLPIYPRHPNPTASPRPLTYISRIRYLVPAHRSARMPISPPS